MYLDSWYARHEDLLDQGSFPMDPDNYSLQD